MWTILEDMVVSSFAMLGSYIVDLLASLAGFRVLIKLNYCETKKDREARFCSSNTFICTLKYRFFFPPGFSGCDIYHFSLSNSVVLLLKLPLGIISRGHREILVRFRARLLRKGQEICLLLKCISSSVTSEEQWAAVLKPGRSFHSIMADISIRFHR